MANSTSADSTSSSGLMTRSHALKVATQFVREAGGSPPVVPESGRPFVLDVFTREWLVVFEEAADPYMALTTGSVRPRYRRVAVHAETGACRWTDGEEPPTG